MKANQMLDELKDELTATLRELLAYKQQLRKMDPSNSDPALKPVNFNHHGGIMLTV